MAKATHTGECQVCGCRQKLPNGKLSTHGYTTRCGFFEGVCYGAKHLPLELSKGLIDGAIQRASYMLAETKAESIALRAGQMLAGGKAWVHVYSSGRDTRGHYRSGYTWTQCLIETEDRQLEKGFTYLIGWYSDDDKKKSLQINCGEKTAEQVKNRLNCRYADHLDHKASELEKYISWQQARIRDWKPRELTPVE